MDKLVSIVIPVYCPDEESLQATRDCIAAIEKYTKNYELILIDNFGSYEFMGLGHNYMYSGKNMGYGPAVNLGFFNAQGDILVAMNNDVVVKEAWLEPLVQTLLNPEIGVVRSADEREVGSGLVVDHTWYHGFCWAITRRTYNRFKEDDKLLDERFRIGYFEDLDLWKRMLDKGMKLAKNFDSRVFHHGGLTMHKTNHSALKDENEARFREKHNMPNWREIFYP